MTEQAARSVTDENPSVIGEKKWKGKPTFAEEAKDEVGKFSIFVLLLLCDAALYVTWNFIDSWLDFAAEFFSTHGFHARAAHVLREVTPWILLILILLRLFMDVLRLFTQVIFAVGNVIVASRRVFRRFTGRK